MKANKQLLLLGFVYSINNCGGWKDNSVPAPPASTLLYNQESICIFFCILFLRLTGSKEACPPAHTEAHANMACDELQW